MIQIPNETIASFLESTYFAERVIGEGQAGHLRNTASMLGRHLGREALLSDLTTETINGWLRSIEATRSPSTMASRRGHIVSIVQAAVDAEAIPAIKTRAIRRYRKNAPKPQSWTPEEVRKLISSARKLEGFHRGTRRAKWWEAYIRTAYDTGLRPVDLHRLSQASVDARGVIAVEQHKTGLMVVRMVRPETLRSIRALGTRDPIFGGYLGKDQRSAWFRRIVESAGLSGTFYRLRSTCGTLVERSQPGKGHVALGNGRAVFERHYYAKQIDASAIPMPPEL